MPRRTTAPPVTHVRPWERYALWAALFFPAAFIVTTIPGVRPHSGYNLLLDGVLNNVAYEMAPVICVLRMRRTRSMRRAWVLLAIALAVYGSGNVFWTLFVRPLAVEPFPSGADALFLAFFPLAFTALMFILRESDNRASASLWLDGLVGGLAVGAVAASVVIGPIVRCTGAGWAAVATTSAYPLLGLVLILVLVSTLSVYRWHPPAGLWLLVAGLSLFEAADVAYMVHVARGTYVSGELGDGIWILATVLMGFAPGWPNRPATIKLPTWAVVSIPLLATSTGLVLLVLDHAHPLHPVAFTLAAATVVLAIARLVVTLREVSSLAESRQLAVTDELTGLANRRALYQEAPARIAELAEEALVVLLLLDLDRFKEVNDSLGHSAGDDMLRDLGERLARHAGGAAELVVRLGGDEFALLMTDTSVEAAQELAGRVRDELARPLSVSGVTVRAEVSVGVAVMPARTAQLSALLRRADVAMYRAKSHHLGIFTYRAEDDAFDSHRLETIEQLRRAIADHSLELHYQPKIDTRSRAVTSVEALVRWNHPTKGLLFPDSFLPLVQQSGLMSDLTVSVLEQALDQAARWYRRGRPLAVAVNLSASSLIDRELPERIAALLAERHLPAQVLEVEITEELLMADRRGAGRILGGLRARGIRVAVDDYGTGYSSLAYLRELPIDELKLDRSFVMGMVEDERSRAIVRSTIALAHSLGLRLVAEGVEDLATSVELADAGCDVEQGWLYAKALPAAELERWVDAWNASPTPRVESVTPAPAGVAS